MYTQIAILSLFIFIYSLISKKIEGSALSGPIIFVGAGLLLGPSFLAIFPGNEDRNTLRMLADFTLAAFLFIDAANAKLPVLVKRIGLPVRLLLISLPLTIIAGFCLALVMFDFLSVFEAAILATMLAATDAALGKAVVTNPIVPARIRESLNAESGLNDGICVPILLLFITLAVNETRAIGDGLGLTLVAQELGVGIVVGIAVSFLCVWALKFFHTKGWTSSLWGEIAPLAIAATCFSVAQSVHASGYIAAFSGGIIFGYFAKEKAHALMHTSEAIAEVLALITWFLFGYAIIGQVMGSFDWKIVLYSLLSLTFVRMIPVLISMIGAKESIKSKVFMGWFGPRGLASIVFAIIVLDEGVENANFLALVVICTVFLSLVLHGITANFYSRQLVKK